MPSIAWNSFTPVSSLAGGLLIGTAAALLVLFCGRIAGISGIVGGLLPAKHSDIAWRVAFLIGLASASTVYRLFASLPGLQIDASYAALAVAGILVGLGTRYGSGCTSGHGVCGLSRLSLRSLAATAAFMSAGFVTVFVGRHWLNA